MIRRSLVAALLAGSLGLAGCAAATPAPAAAPPSAVPTSSAPTAAADPALRGAAGALQDPRLDEPAAAVVPVRVSVPALGVDSTLELLSRDATGWIQPPVQVDEAGWYRDGVVPGAVGPAVIAGHVDSRIGPGVFVDLEDLVAGDRIDVSLSDGSSVSFAVTRSIQVPKEDFPTEAVYGAAPVPELRLITCGGVFDDDYGHYVDNVVVFASLLP